MDQSEIRSRQVKQRYPERRRSLRQQLLGEYVKIGMNDLRGLGIRGAKVPKTSQLKLAWLGDPIVVMKMRLLLDFEQVDLRRLRQCERGSEPTDRALGITPRRRWYYAHDLRQRFCSPQCGKEVRWKRWWQASGKQINEERRKGRLTNG